MSGRNSTSSFAVAVSGRYGYAVFGTEMYEIKYFTDLQGNVDSRAITKIGGGWGTYRTFESSDLWLGT